MDNIGSKPKLVFFQYRYDENLPEFLLMHKRDHIKCLSEFFEVVVIDKDCNYQEICDKYQPDLTLFEFLSGVNHSTCRRLNITDIPGRSEVQRIGLYNADAWCEARAGFFSDMERWGIETLFTISTTTAEHTPEIAENLFIWPNFIDAEIYRDYGQSKVIPILLTGANLPLYPWRQKVYKIVSEYYPSLICPHRGYAARSAAGRVIYGERYARAINASSFVPTCGTIAKEVVRKHFEIPACKACLITERSPGLEAAGFIDMNNCVFADGDNVLDKLDYLFQNPDELERITKAGYELVHSRHTLKQRDQILQWFNLQKQLKSDQKIVQMGPFGPLSVVERSSGTKSAHVKGNGLHLALLQRGDELLWAGKHEEALGWYFRCLNHIDWMPEPKFRLARYNLYRGNAKAAAYWLAGLVRYILVEYRAVDPDPVEWAYFIISLLCLGRLDDAVRRASQFPSLRHPELDRTRWVISVLQNRAIGVPFVYKEETRYRYSIHRLPSRSLTEWVEQLCMMLRACQQSGLAETLRKFPSRESTALDQRQGRCGTPTGTVMKEEAISRAKWRTKSAGTFRREDTLDPFNDRLAGLRARVKKQVAGLLHRLEGKFGYFLPYHLSEMRNDEFFQAIQRLTQDEDIKTALIVGAASGEGTTQAFLTGIGGNRNKPRVFCINNSIRRFVKLKNNMAGGPTVKCYAVSSSSPPYVARELAQIVRSIKEENQIDVFDVILIDSSELDEKGPTNGNLANELDRARFILLDDINSFYNYENHERLLRNPSYVLVAQNPGLRKGYAIFKKSIDIASTLETRQTFMV